MKNIMKYFLWISATLIISSCDDFLTEDPPTLTADADLTSEDAAQAFINSAYANLDVLVQSSGEWGGNTIELLEYPTGKVDGQAQARDDEFNNLRYNAESVYTFDWWSGLYQGIKATNLAIPKVLEGFPSLSEEKRTNLVAEARTLRAFYYFYLVRIFGDVPKITAVAENIDEIRTSRSSVKEIYDEIIIPDLLAAEESNIPWSDQTGHVSMGFIKSLLADVFLTYAGYPVRGGDQYYAESAKRSKEVIASGTFELFPEYEDMINPANKNKGEFIFQIQFDKENRNNPLTPLTLPTLRDVSPAYIAEFGSLVPRLEFIQSYPTGDKRVEEKQFFHTEIAGNPLNGPHIYKYYDDQAIMVTARSELNLTVYRLADVMLMHAEAINRAEGGPNVDAIQYVNNIRNRANLMSIGTMTMEEFEKEVWAQRYFELCFEAKMWFDMVRTHKVRNDISREWDDFVGHTNVFGATYAEKHLVFPISQREIQNNPLLTQNPGY
ncbi:MAG: RagB/SusD family nutrient uptake outer membrane protein [Cyclobacteriaceae bacterium]